MQLDKQWITSSFKRNIGISPYNKYSNKYRAPYSLDSIRIVSYDSNVDSSVGSDIVPILRYG